MLVVDVVLVVVVVVDVGLDGGSSLVFLDGLGLGLGMMGIKIPVGGEKEGSASFVSSEGLLEVLESELESSVSSVLFLDTRMLVLVVCCFIMMKDFIAVC